MRKFRRLTIPQGAHPLTRKLFEEMNKQCIGVCDMADRSGVNKNTICGWRKKSVPDLINIEACYEVLGYKVTVQLNKEAA